ncbi:MAG: hypothetical protein RDV41_14625, partial [Planctomycetota bacterium]|nr:hypothetical protein [Planctomycetota bacterium]
SHLRLFPHSGPTSSESLSNPSGASLPGYAGTAGTHGSSSRPVEVTPLVSQVGRRGSLRDPIVSLRVLCVSVVLCVACAATVAIGQQTPKPAEADEGISAVSDTLRDAIVTCKVDRGQLFQVPPTSPLHKSAWAVAKLTVSAEEKRPVCALAPPDDVSAFTTFSVTQNEGEAEPAADELAAAPQVAQQPNGSVEIDPRGGSVVFALAGGSLFQVAATAAISVEQPPARPEDRQASTIDFTAPGSAAAVRYIATPDGSASAGIKVTADFAKLTTDGIDVSRLQLGFRKKADDKPSTVAPLAALLVGRDGEIVAGLFLFDKIADIAELGREAVLLDRKGNAVASKPLSAFEAFPSVAVPESATRVKDGISRCKALLKRIEEHSALGDQLVPVYGDQTTVGSALACLRPRVEGELRQLEAEATRAGTGTGDTTKPEGPSTTGDATELPAGSWIGASRFFLRLVPVAHAEIKGDSRLESDSVLLHGLGVGCQLSEDWDLILAGSFGEIETEGEPTEDRFIKGLMIEGEKKEHTLTIVDLLCRYSIVSGANARLLLCAGPTWWHVDGEDAVGMTAGGELQWRFGSDSRVVLGLSVTYSEVNLKSDDMDTSGGTVGAFCLTVGR